MESSLAETRCLKLLLEAQNSDGGWGFYSGFASRVEPACWALLALLQAEESGQETSGSIARGWKFLADAQLPDGSWPAAAGQTVGCWVTSLACWALAPSRQYADAVAAGLNWLCSDWPKDSGFFARITRKIFSRKNARNVAEQDDSLRGWGWTPHTASWVEPTAVALIASGQCSADLLPRGIEKRRRLAKRMLLDRVCPGGGWNCGNPRTYGADGIPLVIPTVWALIALRKEVEKEQVQMSLAWLKKYAREICGSGSLALARIGLRMFGGGELISDERLGETLMRNESLRNIAVLAWQAIACGESRWPASEILTRYRPHSAQLAGGAMR